MMLASERAKNGSVLGNPKSEKKMISMTSDTNNATSKSEPAACSNPLRSIVRNEYLGKSVLR